MVARRLPRAIHRPDVVVLGGGPAGLLAAAALSRAGLQVTLAAPDLERPWPNRYGVWIDELEGLALEAALDTAWARAEIILDERRRHPLARAYAKIDGPRLKALLLDRCRDSGVTLRHAAAEAVSHHRFGASVTFADGGSVEALLVVDATGHAARFTERPGRPARAFQTAWGVLATVQGEPERHWAPDAMTLMDFRDPGPGAPEIGGAPSFLYAMPLPDGRWFLEETVLTRAPEVPLSALEGRLHARLRARGLALSETFEVERCRIPMDAPRPRLGQRTLGFGGAASLVHPATGYMLAHTARLAPRMASAVAGALATSSDPARAAAAGWSAVWPADAVRCDELFRLGGEHLTRLDAAATRDFFDAFFAQPDETWRGYLSRDVSASELPPAMLGMFAALAPRRKAGLVMEAVRQPRRLLRGLLPLGP